MRTIWGNRSRLTTNKWRKLSPRHFRICQKRFA